MRRLRLVLALGGLIGLLACAPAGAAGLSPPVADCYAHQALTRSYTAAQLKTGLTTMPADIREYSDCYNVLQQALLEKIGKLGGGDSPGGGGSFLPVWLIVVLAVLVVAGLAFGAVGLRNRARTSSSS